MNWRKKQWLDHSYVKAKNEGYRARSAYKLIEIQDKFGVIQAGAAIIDLGCAPGGWLQVINKYNPRFVVGIDLQNIIPIQNVHFCQLDFTESEHVDRYLSSINAPTRFNTILSDLSPIITGHREVDHYRSVELVRSVYEFSHTHLTLHGFMVCKLFDGQDTRDLTSEISTHMLVKTYKPKTSHQESREIYLVCKKLK